MVFLFEDLCGLSVISVLNRHISYGIHQKTNQSEILSFHTVLKSLKDVLESC